MRRARTSENEGLILNVSIDQKEPNSSNVVKISLMRKLIALTGD